MTSMTYDDFKQLGLKIDMTRGKPSPEQLDLSSGPLLDASSAQEFMSRDGIDCRNYGYPLGLPEARELGGELLGVEADHVVAAGNSSLELMHDAIVFAMLHGMPDGTPWGKQKDIAFLCPVPGYDRHFSICASLGIRMIPVPLTGAGPDMDFVESQVAADPAIKGMWCVPLYSNPTGEIYSSDAIRRLASMPTAANDFRLFWDDAYRFHHLTEMEHQTPNMIETCAAAGHPDRALVFASLSKITLAGAAVAFLASSRGNVEWWQKSSAVRTIGPDKINQLRHVRYLKNRQNLARLMDRHRALLRPRFDAITSTFAELLAGLPNVSWTSPEGGYFISLYTPDGLAKRTVALAADAGLQLTSAGAAFPHGVDPRDRHLRIAPTFPSLDVVRQAARGIALSLRRAIDEEKEHVR
jgi:DNA-binding transcriptional MocR family regulator